MSERDLDRLEYRRSLGLSHDASTCGGAESCYHCARADAHDEDRDLPREVAERLYPSNTVWVTSEQAAARAGAREALLEAAKVCDTKAETMRQFRDANAESAGDLWEAKREACWSLARRLRALAGESAGERDEPRPIEDYPDPRE